MKYTTAHLALLHHIVDLTLLVGTLEQLPLDDVLPELVKAQRDLKAARTAAGMDPEQATR